MPQLGIVNSPNWVYNKNIKSEWSDKMVIDIKPTPDGQWCVIAHTPSGDCHDFFATQQEAIDFSEKFYGGKLVKAAPKTTAEKCLQYGASEHHCTCKDFQNRGGSYVDQYGTRHCKHTLHVFIHGLPEQQPKKLSVEELFGRLSNEYC